MSPYHYSSAHKSNVYMSSRPAQLIPVQNKYRWPVNTKILRLFITKCVFSSALPPRCSVMHGICTETLLINFQILSMLKLFILNAILLFHSYKINTSNFNVK